MVPETLDGWTLDALTALLQQGVFESDRFDFKEKLPHKQETSEKQRLVRTCAAFANSSGGFLIFGVKDAKGIPVADRLAGMDSTEDFPEKFGNYPRDSQPAVDWQFKNPPIVLSSGRVVHVVHVPRSRRAPHAVDDGERWWFCKRTSKGTESMTYEEVRLAFQDTELRRTKLALVHSELLLIHQIATALKQAMPNGPTQNSTHMLSWLTRYPTSVLDSVLGDAFALLANDGTTWTALSNVRHLSQQSNTLADAILQLMSTALSSAPERLARYQAQMLAFAGQIMEACAIGARRVEQVLKGTA